MVDTTTLPAIPPPAGQTPNFINPTSAGPQITETIVITLLFAMIVVVLRIWTRAVILRKLGLDDYLLMISVIFALLFQAAGLYSVKLGLGRDMWNVPATLYGKCLQWFFVTEMFYYVAIMFCKLSILAFYLRFCIERRQTYTIYGLLALIAVYNIISIFVLLFACKPVSKLWDPTITGGYCVDTDPVYIVNSVLNTLTDLIILVMPMRMLWKLRLPVTQKITLGLVFVAGGFIIIVTVLRLLSLNNIGANGENISYGFILPCIWSIVEVNLCLVCASVPALKPLFQRYFASLTEWSSQYSRRRNGDLELSEDIRKSHNSHSWSKQRGVTNSKITTGRSIIADGRGDSFDRIVDQSPDIEHDGIMKGTQVEVSYELAPSRRRSSLKLVA